MKRLLFKVLLRNAVSFEEASYRFYRAAEEKAVLPEHKQLFSFLAGEELKHKERLKSLSESEIKGVLNLSGKGEISTLKLPGAEIPEGPEAATGPGKILLLALEREVASYNFYLLLAKRSKIATAKKVFQFLASEEEKHKSKLEAEYGKFSHRGTSTPPQFPSDETD